MARQAAAAVDVGTCWPQETAATLPSFQRRKALRRPLGYERGGSISWRPPAYSLFSMASDMVRCRGDTITVIYTHRVLIPELSANLFW